MKSAFATTIKSHVNSSAIQPGFRGAFSVLGRILDAVKNIVETVGGGMTPDIKAQLEAAACQVFDQLVILPEPFDALSDVLFKSALDKLLGV